MFTIRKFGRTVLRLELFEVVGLAACLAAFIVFISTSRRLSEVYGVHLVRSNLVNAVIGLLEHPLPWAFIGMMTLLVAAYMAVRKLQPRFADSILYILRIMVGFTVLMAIYKIVNFYTDVFNPFDRDAAIAHIDRTLFLGKLPSQWLEPIISRPLTYFLSGVYMSWFVLSYATVLVMLPRGREAMRQYISMALLTFYVGYFTYFLVPVIGPVFTVAYAHPVGGITTLFAHDEALIARDCFPSLHTGISIVMAVSVWRHQRKWAWFYVPIAGLIIFSTIYLRFHYALDVIAGASLAFAMTQLVPQYVAAWSRLRETNAFAGESVPHRRRSSENAYSELA